LNQDRPDWRFEIRKASRQKSKAPAIPESGNPEKAVFDADELLNEFILPSDLGFIVSNERGKILFANRGAAEILGRQEMKGHNLFAFLPPDSMNLVKDDDIRQLCESNFQASEYSQPKNLLVSKSAVSHKSGTKLVFVITDVTPCRQMEEEKAKNRNLMEIGRFAAHLAHEIKNPITGIRGVMEMMSAVHKKGDPRFEVFQEALTQINRLDCLVKDLLSFSKRIKPAMEIVPLRDILESSISIAWLNNRNKKIKLDADFGDEDNKIKGDLLLLQQVFVNLITNAIEAIEAKGNIVVSVRGFSKKVEVSITDDGIGMSPEILTTIFEPFFTTKSGGTGLGLPLVQKILQIHDATIKIISQEKRGTTFTVAFPLHRG
jgi:PAS domain S-box-containing protein